IDFLVNVRQAHAEKFFARIDFVDLHRQESLVDFVFKCWSIFTLNQSMNIKFKRHTRITKFVNTLLRVWPPRLSYFVNAFAKRPDVGNNVNVSLLCLLRDCECLLCSNSKLSTEFMQFQFVMRLLFR